MAHPFRDVAIAGVFNTEQARRLDGHDSASIAVEGALGALHDAGIGVEEVDGIAGQFAADMVLGAHMGPCSRKLSTHGIPTILDAASMIAFGECEVVVIAAGGAAMYTERSATAPWTRPANELVVGYGLFTAAEFALMARRHMLMYGTTPEQLAAVGRHDPQQRARQSRSGVLRAWSVQGRRHPCVAHGGRSVPLARVCDDLRRRLRAGAHDRSARQRRRRGSGVDPRWRRRHLRPGVRRPAGVGPARTRRPPGWLCRPPCRGKCFELAGLGPDDVDVAELYDPFSFEIIRQLEAFDFCGDGDGGPFVEEGHIGPGGRIPVTTDGGTMSYSHAGLNVQMLQRVIRGVQQLRGTCVSAQVPDAEVALCSNGGSGALFNDVMLLGSERP